jgi:hypothetical protein
LFLLAEHGAGPVGPLWSLGHHLVSIDQQFTGLSLEKGGIEGDAASARIQLGDQGLDPISLAKNLTQVPQLTTTNCRLVQQTAHTA